MYIMNSSKREKTPSTNFVRNTSRRKRRTANICSMKAGRRNLKIKPTQANSWQQPCFLVRARLTGCRHNFPSLSLISAFSLNCFSRNFSHRFPANSMGYLCCGLLGVRSSRFIGGRPVPVDSCFDEV